MRVSVSVSVPVDFELTGESVPSTLSSRKIFRGEGGMIPPPADAILDLEAVAAVVVEAMEVKAASVVIVEDINSSTRLLKTKWKSSLA